MSAWQPIETAPRDGTDFIVGHFARFDPVTGQLQEQTIGGSYRPLDGNPLHWCAAPEDAS